MLGFILGISITLNVITVIGIIIYLSVKNKALNTFSNKFVDELDNEEIVDKESASDFMNDDKVDFSSLLRR